MRILFASRRPAYPLFLGGSERSFYELGRALAEAGHHVTMIGESSRSIGPVDDLFAALDSNQLHWNSDWTVIAGERIPSVLNLELRLHERLTVIHTFLSDFAVLVGELIDRFDPDVVCTQLNGAEEVLKQCEARKKPTIHFVRDTFDPSNFHVLSGVDGSAAPAMCIANSGFTADFVRKALGVASRVLYPVVRLPKSNQKPVAVAQRRLLFVNPAPYKGGLVMYDVACELADIQFVVVPGWGMGVPACWSELSNAEVHAWPVARMEELYASADLVVVPTRHSEGFGRVAIEAQLAGVPVMASRHSALEEVLGDTAILVDDFTSPRTWIDEIRQAFDSPARLLQISSAGTANAKRFSGPEIVRQFEQFMTSIL